MLKKSVFITCILIFASSCSTPSVQYAEIGEVLEIKQDVDSIPLALSKVVVKLRRLELLGRVSGGWLCIDQGPLEWQGGKLNITTEEITEIFRDEMVKGGYPIVGDPNALFEDPDMSKAELLVGGSITSLEANFCYPNIGYGDSVTAKGGAFMEIDWQVYNTLDRKVVFQTSTKGSYESQDAKRDGTFLTFSTAFANATQNLMAEPGFYNLVTRPIDFAEVQNFKPIDTNLNDLSLFKDKIQTNNDRVAQAVVTVRTNSGHGSGFFIGNKGYIISNEHVVSGAKFVKIITSTGREILGEVVRTDKARDLALITVGEARIGLPLNKSSGVVGQDVYAAGSPLLESFNLTITKGIYSSLRVSDRGFELIQSDVQVAPGSSGGPLLDDNGNVIGVTVSGIGRGEMGINFFVPAKDLEKYLGIY
ncbi:serine protease [Gammaproteobacteria bacterium]|nr:serine protease [Gammaproteobacteria bacterium]